MGCQASKDQNKKKNKAINATLAKKGNRSRATLDKFAPFGGAGETKETTAPSEEAVTDREQLLADREQLLADRFNLVKQRLYDPDDPNATFRLATLADLQPGKLLTLKTKAHLCTFVNPQEPVIQHVCGLNDYEEKLTPDDGETKDGSSMSNLKKRNNRYAPMANYHHNRLGKAIGMVPKGRPALCTLQKGYGTRVKCLSFLVPNQKTDDGQTITLERCLVSCEHEITAAAAGEARLTNVASGISDHLDDPPTADHLTHVREYWEDNVNGTDALENPHCFLVIATSPNTGKHALEIMCNGRWNTKPGKIKVSVDFFRSVFLLFFLFSFFSSLMIFLQEVMIFRVKAICNTLTRCCPRRREAYTNTHSTQWLSMARLSNVRKKI